MSSVLGTDPTIEYKGSRSSLYCTTIRAILKSIISQAVRETNRNIYEFLEGKKTSRSIHIQHVALFTNCLARKFRANFISAPHYTRSAEIGITYNSKRQIASVNFTSSWSGYQKELEVFNEITREIDFTSLNYNQATEVVNYDKILSITF